MTRPRVSKQLLCGLGGLVGLSATLAAYTQIFPEASRDGIMNAATSVGKALSVIMAL